MIILYSAVALGLLISLIADRQKTLKALKIALKKFLFLLPMFLLLSIAVGVLLTLMPPEQIMEQLGEKNLLWGSLLGGLLGSISFIPGFIVFPLGGLLKDQGMAITIISALTSSLMMVGILTLPMEREYMGGSLALKRNGAALIIAAVVTLCTGIFFGEISL